jgi:hypothetical protein
MTEMNEDMKASGHNMFEELSDGVLYLEGDYWLVSIMGESLLVTLRADITIMSDEEYCKGVRRYLEMHGQVIGRGGPGNLSERRMLLYGGLDGIDRIEIAERLEVFLSIADKTAMRLNAVNLAVVLMFRSRFAGR